MFDGSTSVQQRRLRLLAALPVSEDPLQIGSRPHRIPVPWISWPGIDALAGVLVVSSTSKPEIQRPTSLTLISSESSGAIGTTLPRHRRTYRVDDPDQLGEVIWAPMPGRVNVLVDSQLTIHPDSAEWLAVLRYDVVGGALDSIHLRMPASWSPAANRHFPGGRHQLTTEKSGQTSLWTITPERPIWGSHRLVIRSSIPLSGEREIVYPEISPLGRGAVDACLAVVNATGRPATIENPFGLEAIDHSARFRAREFAPLSGSVLGAFRVVKEAPVLKVQLPRDTAGSVDSREGTARLGFADVEILVMPDSSTIGRAAYDAIPGSGTFLPFELPSGSTLLWATVDSSPASALRRSSGIWSIALDENRQSHVNVIWRTSPSGLNAAANVAAIGIPRVGQGMATSVVTVHVPAEFTLEGDVGGLRATSMARLETARADWMVRSIDDFIPKIDRSSSRDHQKLVAMLISHEMYLRAALRSEITGLAADKSPGEQPPTSLAWIQAARAARADAVRRAGLEPDLAVANRYLGEATANSKGTSIGAPEANAPERIRAFGRPISFMGILPGIEEAPSKLSLILERRPWG